MFFLTRESAHFVLSWSFIFPWSPRSIPKTRNLVFSNLILIWVHTTIFILMRTLTVRNRTKNTWTCWFHINQLNSTSYLLYNKINKVFQFHHTYFLFPDKFSHYMIRFFQKPFRNKIVQNLLSYQMIFEHFRYKLWAFQCFFSNHALFVWSVRILPFISSSAENR